MDAEHIVILMQENRSFDHALGTLQGVRGFNAPRALRQPNVNSVFVQIPAKTGKTFALCRLDLECPAQFVPVEVRQTGTRGAEDGARQEA